jgi:hypothetical protein
MMYDGTWVEVDEAQDVAVSDALYKALCAMPECAWEGFSDRAERLMVVSTEHWNTKHGLPSDDSCPHD